MFVSAKWSRVNNHTVIASLCANQPRSIRGQCGRGRITIDADANDLEIEEVRNVEKVANVMEGEGDRVPLELRHDTAAIVDDETAMLGANYQ